MLSSTSALLFSCGLSAQIPGGEWRQHLYHPNKTCSSPFFRLLSVLLISLLILSTHSFNSLASSSFLYLPPLHSLPTLLFICLLSFSPCSFASLHPLASLHLLSLSFLPFSPLSFLCSSTVSPAQDHRDTTVISHQLRRRLATQSWGYRASSCPHPPIFISSHLYSSFIWLSPLWYFLLPLHTHPFCLILKFFLVLKCQN